MCVFGGRRLPQGGFWRITGPDDSMEHGLARQARLSERRPQRRQAGRRGTRTFSFFLGSDKRGYGSLAGQPASMRAATEPGFDWLKGCLQLNSTTF